MIPRTLRINDLKRNAETFFSNREIDTDMFYDWINTKTYLSDRDLLSCIKWIDWDLEVDKWYIYGDTSVDYLTAIVATYLDNYIRKNYSKRNSTWRVD